MSKTRYYHQCSLQKGNTHQLTHLPEEYAQVGRQIRLRNEDEVTWDTGWIVKSVGEPIDAQYAEARAGSFDRIWKPSAALTTRGKK